MVFVYVYQRVPKTFASVRIAEVVVLQVLRRRPVGAHRCGRGVRGGGLHGPNGHRAGHGGNGGWNLIKRLGLKKMQGGILGYV